MKYDTVQFIIIQWNTTPHNIQYTTQYTIWHNTIYSTIQHNTTFYNVKPYTVRHNTVQYTTHTIHCTQHTLHNTIYSAQYNIQYTTHRRQYTAQYTIHSTTLHTTSTTLQCNTIHSPHYTTQYILPAALKLILSLSMPLEVRPSKDTPFMPSNDCRYLPV